MMSFVRPGLPLLLLIAEATAREAAPEEWAVEFSSALVVQTSTGADTAPATTYYRASGRWQIRPRWRLAAEFEGGQSTTASRGGVFGDAPGSQWDLNELQEDSPLFVPTFHLAGANLPGSLDWQVGKISPKSVMDGNMAARSKLTKFIAEPFTRNSAVAFARKGIGGALRWQPSALASLALCASDANARSGKTGLTTWRGEWYRAAELTLSSRSSTAPAALRLLGWGMERNRVHDGGWGVSADWEFMPDWVAFARAGGGSAHFAASRRLLSGGVAWQAPFGRKREFLAVGVARGEALADDARTETLLEFVYRRQVSRRLALSPDVQYLRHRTEGNTSQVWRFGLRCVVFFGVRRSPGFIALRDAQAD